MVNRVETRLRILVVLTLSLSALLLGMSQGAFEPFFIAVAAATVAWITVDVYRWFSLPQWLANTIAVIVTMFTVAAFFFTGDSIRQLLGVGKLLVYLQSILLFQKKSARVYWQVLSLSLLQIVVGAVFNLGFEGGVLFIVYLFMAGLTTMHLHLYQQRESISRRKLGPGRPARNATPAPFVFEEPQVPTSLLDLKRLSRGFFRMAGGAFVFGLCLFYLLPREHSAWSGPIEVDMQSAGHSLEVSLDHPDVIPTTTKLVLTAKYVNNRGELVEGLPEPPYFRGLALSNLKIENNATTWTPASTQVQQWDYRPLNYNNRYQRTWTQEIVLEPTDDPLVYSTAVAFGMGNERDEEIEYCWPLGGLTRERFSDKIAVTHYRYSLVVPVEDDGTFPDAWPYEPRTGRQPLNEAEDPATYKWLTYLDPTRYPRLVNVAEEVVANARTSNHLQMAKALERSFSESRGFRYTIDFRDVTRDRSLDPIEDFVANHRSGHCSYYASALVLMLRSQGIPARVVVGYRGGQESDYTDQLFVEERNAHAWVEAYIRPEDCPQTYLDRGYAGRFGCWVRLDATPSFDIDNLLTADALNLARNFWRDYVLGLQADTGSTVISADGIQLGGFLQLLDLGWWQRSFSSASSPFVSGGTWQNWLLRLSPLLLIPAFFGFRWWRRRQPERREKRGGKTRRNLSAAGLGKWLGQTLQGLSPSLGKWLTDRAERAALPGFYRDFCNLLAERGLERRAGETPLEFATNAFHSNALLEVVPAAGPVRDEMNRLARDITGLWYSIRFGRRSLSSELEAQGQRDIARLKDLLQSQGTDKPSTKGANLTR